MDSIYLLTAVSSRQFSIFILGRAILMKIYKFKTCMYTTHDHISKLVVTHFILLFLSLMLKSQCLLVKTANCVPYFLWSIPNTYAKFFMGLYFFYPSQICCSLDINPAGRSSLSRSLAGTVSKYCSTISRSHIRFTCSAQLHF